MTEVSLLSNHNENSKVIKQFFNCIYLIENIVNQKVYIGQARNLWERVKQHRYESKIKDKHLYNSMRKYGKENFRLYVLDKNINLIDLDVIETAYIQVYQSHKREKGYNILPFARMTKGYKFTETQKEKIKNTDTRVRKVCQLNPKTSEIIAVFNSITEAEQFLNVKRGSAIGAACRGKIHVSLGYKWKYLDESFLIRKENKRIETTRSKKKVCQIHPGTLETLNIFNSVSEAEIFLGIEKYNGGINSCCRGLLHTSHGFKWKYFEEDLIIKQDGRKRPLTEETKRKLSESHKGKKYGTTKRVYQIDKDTLEIIKEYSSLSEAADKTSIKISAICNSCKNIVRTAGKFIWKYADSELIFKSKTESKSMKKVIQIDVNTKQIINTFDSITEASVSAKVSDCTVRRHCQNQVKNPEIFTWKYYTDLQ